MTAADLLALIARLRTPSENETHADLVKRHTANRDLIASGLKAAFDAQFAVDHDMPRVANAAELLTAKAATLEAVVIAARHVIARKPEIEAEIKAALVRLDGSEVLS